VLSRFCCVDYEKFDIVGIHIHRITRVINRSLRIRFDDALRSYLDDDESYLPSAKSAVSLLSAHYIIFMLYLHASVNLS